MIETRFREEAPFAHINAEYETKTGRELIKKLGDSLKEMNKGNADADKVSLLIKEGTGKWKRWLFVEIEANEVSEFYYDHDNAIRKNKDERKMTCFLPHDDISSVTLGSHQREQAKVLIRWTHTIDITGGERA